MCQDPITLEPHEVRSLPATKERPLPLVNQPQTRLAGVADPSETASGLIADVPLDDGFSLEPVCYFPAQLSAITDSTTTGVSVKNRVPGWE